MGLVITKDFRELTGKAKSLLYLQQLNLPIPPTIIIPYYKRGDTLSIEELGTADSYYIRLYFKNEALGRSEWRVVQGDEVSRYLEELAVIADTNEGDLFAQPLLNTTYSGAVLKRSNIILAETAYGLAPTLLHRGRFSYRVILMDEQTVISEMENQGIAVIRENNSITTVQETGWDKYNPQSIFLSIAKLLKPIDNILLEWGVVNDSVAFFDHKQIDDTSALSELNQSPPRIPRSITTNVKDFETSPLPKRVLYVDYPEFQTLNQARNYDYVLVNKGALLSHLSVYSLFENYKCIFI